MKTVRVALCLMVLAAGGAAAQQKSCSAAEAAAAEKSIDRVMGWSALHKAWQDFRHCDSGPVDELFTDAILRLTVDWKNVEAFAADVQKDAAYKQFVYRHLRSPAAKDDQEAIYSRAKKSCPASIDGFCADLAEVVKPR